MKRAVVFIFLMAVCWLQNVAQRPNVLMIVADDAGLDYSAYGSSYVKTPAFDALAAEGLLFNNAYTPNAKCAPSRSCILTGRNPWQLDAAVNHWIYFPPKFKTYAEVLKDNGYAIGHTGKGYSPGIALHDDGKPRNLLGPSFDTFQLKPPTKEIARHDYAKNFQHFLQQQKGPWCFWVGFNEPHRAYEYGSGVKLGGKQTSQIKKVPAYFPDTDTVRNDLLDYAFEIEYMDAQVARIVKDLKASGQFENTLIIITSDHGMPFPRVKGNQYERSNHVPFAVVWKGKIIKPGRKINNMVSFIDIAPTILDAAGIKWQESGMQPAAGKSLVPLLKADAQTNLAWTRNYVLVGQERHDLGRPHDAGYPIRGIYKDNMLLLVNYETDRWPACNPETGYMNVDGSPTKTYILNQRRYTDEKWYWKMSFGHRPAVELYDLSKDADCVNNLAAQAAYRAKLASMRTFMEKQLMEQNDLRMIGYGHLYELYPSVSAPGFYERWKAGESFSNFRWFNQSDMETEPVEDY